MDLIYHKQITTEALDGLVSSRAMSEILKGNFGQDKLIYLLGNHPEYHFDDSKIKEGHAYIRQQEAMILQLLKDQGSDELKASQMAWWAFGRISHGIQDYYAHSNYVVLWTNLSNGKKSSLQPDEIVPLVPEIINSPDLMTAQVYFPLEALTIFPWLRPVVSRWLPADSHANMNLDNPGRGENYYFAAAAAKKHTRILFEQLLARIRTEIGDQGVNQFRDLG